MTPKKQTAFHYKHLALDAKMVEDYGWLRPDSYADPEAERRAIRDGVGLFDDSPQGKIEVVGDASGDVLKKSLNARQVPAPGQWCHVQPPEGRIAWNRPGPDHHILMTPPAVVGGLFTRLASEVPGEVTVVDMTSATATLTLLGPRSQDVLRQLTDLDVPLLPAQAAVRCKLAKIHVTLLRWNQDFELHFAREYGEYMWDVLMESGREFGLTPLGFSARKSLIRSV